MEEPGYLYIYLSNESPDGGEAFFDDFTLCVSESPIIQTIDYYPYGLLAKNWQRLGENATNELFQGKTYDELTGWYDFHARQYDAALGRWFGVDPQDQFASPYVGMGNNPVMMVDPDGEWVNLIVGAIVGGTANVLFNLKNIDNFGQGLKYFGIGAAAGALGAGVGAGISSTMAGGSFGAGFVGSSAAQAVSSSFISGSAIGAGSGFSSGFTTGFGNGLMDGQNFGEALRSGVKAGTIAGVSGATFGGVLGGIDAYRNDRNFWTGELSKGGDKTYWGEITLKARISGEESSVIDGHSWLEVTDAKGNVTSYGTWGNQAEGEFLTNFRGDLGVHYNVLSTKKSLITRKHV